MCDLDIHATMEDDLKGMKQVLDKTGLFPSEMLEDMIQPYLSGKAQEIWLTAQMGKQVVGLCYTVPETFADGVWNMLALGVLPAEQSKGLGGRIVKHLETQLRDRFARMLIVDTSGTSDFKQARGFYTNAGYEAEARIRDYWTEGDDKVTFRKLL